MQKIGFLTEVSPLDSAIFDSSFVAIAAIAQNITGTQYFASLDSTLAVLLIDSSSLFEVSIYFCFK